MPAPDTPRPNLPPLRPEPIVDENALPDRQRRGRGAVSNRLSGRFAAPDRYEIDDGWTVQERDQMERVRTVLVSGRSEFDGLIDAENGQVLRRGEELDATSDSWLFLD